MPNITTHLSLDSLVDANATLKSTQQIVRDYLEALKKQDMISSVNVQMQGDDILVDYTLPTPIKEIDMTTSMKGRLTEMFTPDPIQVCLDNTRLLLEKHRTSPITEDLTIELMERFAEIMLKAHDIDANVDIHGIEVTDKERF